MNKYYAVVKPCATYEKFNWMVMEMEYYAKKIIVVQDSDTDEGYEQMTYSDKWWWDSEAFLYMSKTMNKKIKEYIKRGFELVKE